VFRHVEFLLAGDEDCAAAGSALAGGCEVAENGAMRGLLGIAVVLLCICLPPANGVSMDWKSARTHKAPSTIPEEERLDINFATVEEMLKVPGMTPVWAHRIVRFRPYRTRQELLDEGVVPPAVYRRIKDYLIAHRKTVVSG
jgi:DNA uptake protein ComE-like DNA-binding protein